MEQGKMVFSERAHWFGSTRMHPMQLSIVLLDDWTVGIPQEHGATILAIVSAKSNVLL